MTQSSPTPEGIDRPASIVRSFRAHPSALYEIRAYVRELAEREQVAPDELDDLLLAVTEACGNAIVHTNTASLEITCRFTSLAMEVQVRDTGVFRRQLPVPGLGARGRGIPLMMALMDEVTIREGNPSRPGTMVRLVKATNSGAESALA